VKKMLRKAEASEVASEVETPPKLSRLGSGTLADVLMTPTPTTTASPSLGEPMTPSTPVVDLTEPSSLYLETLALLGIELGDSDVANFTYKPCAAFTDALRIVVSSSGVYLRRRLTSGQPRPPSTLKAGAKPEGARHQWSISIPSFVVRAGHWKLLRLNSNRL